MQGHSWHGGLVAQYARSPGHKGCSDVSILVFQAKRAQRVKHSLLQSGEQVLWVPKHYATPVESAG